MCPFQSNGQRVLQNPCIAVNFDQGPLKAALAESTAISISLGPAIWISVVNNHEQEGNHHQTLKNYPLDSESQAFPSLMIRHTRATLHITIEPGHTSLLIKFRRGNEKCSDMIASWMYQLPNTQEYGRWSQYQ